MTICPEANLGFCGAWSKSGSPAEEELCTYVIELLVYVHEYCQTDVSVNANYAAECHRNAINVGLCMYVFVGVAAGPFTYGGHVLLYALAHDEWELSLCM